MNRRLREPQAGAASYAVTFVTAIGLALAAICAMAFTARHDSVTHLQLRASSNSAAVSVKIKSYAFSPATLTISPGTKVTWTNYDSAPHTVTSSSGPEKLDSPNLNKGDSWSFTFTKPGTYEYYCSVHPDMKAKVVVTSGSGGSGGSGASGGGSGGSGGSGGGSGGSGGGSGGSGSGTGGSGSGTGGMGSGSGSSATGCQDLASAVADPFIMHVQHGHLSESPAQQAGDILNTSQYVQTHTVLIEAMTNPVWLFIPAVTESLSAFVTHVRHGHLDESPSQQAADLLDPNQYVNTHTVLIDNMTAPITDAAVGC